MKKHLFLIFIILLICIVLFSACSTSGQYFLFGTFVDLEIEGVGSKKTEQQIEIELTRLENLFSATIENSDIWRINNSKAGVPVEVSNDTMNCLVICENIYKASNGAFDPTVYPLVKLWKFSADTYTGLASPPPPNEDIEELLQYVGFENMLTLDKNNNSVTKAFSEVQIDFGGVAKGYAAQKAAEIATGKKALLNLGGNIACVGQDYNIGVANPRESQFAYFGSMSIENGYAISTSGDYERYYEYDNIRYHHIINPKTGYPSGIDPSTGEMEQHRLISATIISQEFGECDAVATAVIILGKTKGQALVEDLGLKAVLIDIDLNYFTVGNLNFIKKQ